MAANQLYPTGALGAAAAGSLGKVIASLQVKFLQQHYRVLWFLDV
jgi:hypothetical protein